MPSRKNRTDKFGLQAKKTPQVTPLIEMLLWNEQKFPRVSHYIGWPSMSEAERLEKNGFLDNDYRALGRFFVTDVFRERFIGGVS